MQRMYVTNHEHDLRAMIRMLNEYVSASRERTDNVEWQAVAWTRKSCHGRIERVHNPFAGGVRRRGDGDDAKR